MDSVEKLYRQADDAEKNGDTRRAEQLYREILAIEESAPAWGMLAWLCLQHGEAKDALNAAKRMRILAGKQKKDSLLATANALMARIHQSAGRRALAERYYTESLEVDERPETLIMLGNMLAKSEGRTREKVCYRRALEIDPCDAEARYLLAKWYYVHNDINRTIKHLRLVIEDAPGHADSLVMLSVVFWMFESNGLKQARNLLEKAVQLRPHHCETRILLALTQFQLGKPHLAEKEFRAALKDIGLESRILWSFALFLTRAKQDHSEAEELFEKAIEINPEDMAAKYYFAKHLMNSGERARATNHLQAAIRGGFDRAKILLEELKALD